MKIHFGAAFHGLWVALAGIAVEIVKDQSVQDAAKQAAQNAVMNHIPAHAGLILAGVGAVASAVGASVVAKRQDGSAPQGQ